MQNINIQKFNIEIVKMDKSMLSSVQQIAASTLGSSFVNEEILNNDINLCAKIEEKLLMRLLNL